MSADASTTPWIAEDLVPSPAAARRPAAAGNIPGIFHLRVAAGVEDVLALLRSAVLLARQFDLALTVALPDAAPGHAGSANSSTQMHLGSAPCTAFLSALLHSVEQRLRKLNPGSGDGFLAEFGFSIELRGLLFRIHPAATSPRQAK